MLSESRIDFEGVIFDFDNTLVDTASAVKESYFVVFSKIAEDFNVDLTKLLEEADKFQAEKIKESALLKKSYNHADWIGPIAAKQGIKLGDKEKDYKDIFYAHIVSHPKFSGEVITILEELKKKNKKIALLSEKDSVPGMKTARIRNAPFYKYFDSIVVAGETVPFSKVNDGSKVFIATADKLGLKPEKVVMIGDRPDLDVQNAKEAGMKAILFTGYSNSNEHTKYSPDFVAKSLDDIKSLLI